MGDDKHTDVKGLPTTHFTKARSHKVVVVGYLEQYPKFTLSYLRHEYAQKRQVEGTNLHNVLAINKIRKAHTTLDKIYFFIFN
ncbi:hypothetical protein [Vibrio penaeicida]|uniref:Uncharacterized protein n=1 Tax=Vibrio penaeicida TaxID=104609 RepID=A0AAV5NYA4_9VIBR|nr:hypothetical protein [Vibrio penaeicida]RTZ21776.1 hypothetical protein EKN09_17615 [Vibrio penaeicida]GLQ75641.1 hypothetical protein GCM10007932_50030 [Vibrio penaeicida]